MLNRFLLKIFSRGSYPSPKAVYAARAASEGIRYAVSVVLYLALACGLGVMLALWLSGEASLR